MSDEDHPLEKRVDRMGLPRDLALGPKVETPDRGLVSRLPDAEPVGEAVSKAEPSSIGNQRTVRSLFKHLSLMDPAERAAVLHEELGREFVDCHHYHIPGQPNRNGDLFDPTKCLEGPAAPGPAVEGFDPEKFLSAPLCVPHETIPLLDAEDICTCCGKPNGDWKECRLCNGRICASCWRQVTDIGSDFCVCRRCEAIGDDCDYLNLSLNPVGKLELKYTNKDGAKPGSIRCYGENPELVKILGEIITQANALITDTKVSTKEG